MLVFLVLSLSFFFFFCIPIPYDEKDTLFDISSRRCCINRSSYNRSTSASSASVGGAETWVTVILNGLPWKRTEIILSFLRLQPSTALDSFVDYEGYSISSKGISPTVVDVMVILIEFAHSCPF